MILYVEEQGKIIHKKLTKENTENNSHVLFDQPESLLFLVCREMSRFEEAGLRFKGCTCIHSFALEEPPSSSVAIWGSC